MFMDGPTGKFSGVPRANLHEFFGLKLNQHAVKCRCV